MSAKTEANLDQNRVAWRKRSLDEEAQNEGNKRPRYYYFRLESESSRASISSDTESIYSIQDKETDFVKDTSDTNSKDSLSEYEVEVEYEIASMSDGDDIQYSSASDSEDIMLAAAAVICDTSLEAWVTDGEDSDNSSLDDPIARSDFGTCVQCKSRNNNPLFRYCEKCFQNRKSFYPPRPRRHKKLKKCENTKEVPVKLDALRSFLSGSSHDSGLGSSQECPALNLDKIVVPENLTTMSSSSSTTTTTTIITTTTKETAVSAADEKLTTLPTANRKRQISESSLSEYDVVPKRCKRNMNKSNDMKQSKEIVVQNTDEITNGEDNGNKGDVVVTDLKTNTTETNVNVDLTNVDGGGGEKCILCCSNPRNGIFVHGRLAHMYCCYKCAVRTYETSKKCPVCKRRLNNVLRVVS